MGHDDDASPEAAEEWDTHRRQVSRLASSGFLGRPRHLLERRVLKDFIIANFYHYNRVLLKKTNLMIYNMLYKI